MKNGSPPLITIVIPVYNCERFVRECLDSLANQTFKDFEIVIVDDGSSDSTCEIIERHAAENGLRINLIKQENGGASKARNTGLENVSGEFIAFIDADDTVSPDYLETLLSHFDDSVDIVSCGYQKYESETGEISYVRDVMKWELDFGDGVSHLLHYSPWAKLMRSSLIQENDLRFKEGEILEDGPFGIMTNSLARSNIAIPYLGYQYRIREGSVQDAVRKKGIEESNDKMRAPFGGLRIAIEKIQKNRSPEYDKALEYVVAKALAGYVFSFSKNDSSESLEEICRQSVEILDEHFPDIAKNEYIRIGSFAHLPLSHRAATVILVKSYERGRLVPVAKFFHAILRHFNIL